MVVTMTVMDNLTRATIELAPIFPKDHHCSSRALHFTRNDVFANMDEAEVREGEASHTQSHGLQ